MISVRWMSVLDSLSDFMSLVINYLENIAYEIR